MWCEMMSSAWADLHESAVGHKAHTHPTNDQAQSRPAVRVLQEERDDLDGVHQNAISEDQRR